MSIAGTEELQYLHLSESPTINELKSHIEFQTGIIPSQQIIVLMV